SVDHVEKDVGKPAVSDGRLSDFEGKNLENGAGILGGCRAGRRRRLEDQPRGSRTRRFEVQDPPGQLRRRPAPEPSSRDRCLRYVDRHFLHAFDVSNLADSETKTLASRQWKCETARVQVHLASRTRFVMAENG